MSEVKTRVNDSKHVNNFLITVLHSCSTSRFRFMTNNELVDGDLRTTLFSIQLANTTSE
jgi:hypothetical protein